MYLLYVDESGDSGFKGSRHLLLGAAALFEGKWRAVKDNLEDLLERYFSDLADRPAELHCTDVRRGRGPYSKLSKEDRSALLREACELLANLAGNEIALFSVVCDKQWWFRRNPGKSGDDLYLWLFENLISRFDLFLVRRHQEGQPSKGLIIADPRNSALSKALRQAVIQFHRTGTRWTKLRNVVESVLFLESHESPGVQFADLCSYAMWRGAEYGDTTLLRKLKYCFDREGFAGGGTRKWHGFRFDGPHDSPVRTMIRTIWL